MELSRDVLDALNVCEDFGVDVDTTSVATIFPSITGQYLGTSSNIGALMGVTTNAVKKDLRWYGVPSITVSVILDEIRRQVFEASNYDEALYNLMTWVGQEETDYDDYDEDGYN